MSSSSELPGSALSDLEDQQLCASRGGGLLDLSDRIQVRVCGPGVARALERFIKQKISKLATDRQIYIQFNEGEGVIEDMTISRLGSHEFYLVVNSPGREPALNRLKHAFGKTRITVLEDRALLALQGPSALRVLANLAPGIRELVFMSGLHTHLLGERCYITRSSYTGENGFSISISNTRVSELTRLILLSESVWPVARDALDSLQIEAAMLLYGHDLDHDSGFTNTGLQGATITRCRSEIENPTCFFTAKIDQLKNLDNGSYKRMGFIIQGSQPLGAGAEITDNTGTAVGIVSRSGYAPTLGKPVGMGYTPLRYTRTGVELFARDRHDLVPITVVPTPLVARPRFRRQSHGRAERKPETRRSGHVAQTA